MTVVISRSLLYKAVLCEFINAVLAHAGEKQTWLEATKFAEAERRYLRKPERREFDREADFIAALATYEHALLHRALPACPPGPNPLVAACVNDEGFPDFDLVDDVGFRMSQPMDILP